MRKGKRVEKMESPKCNILLQNIRDIASLGLGVSDTLLRGKSPPPHHLVVADQRNKISLNMVNPIQTRGDLPAWTFQP